MNYHEIAELISLAWTPSTIIMSLLVVYLWGKSAFESFLNPNKESYDWFIVGVAVGFLGSSFDNLYWGVAWTLSFLQSDAKEWWFTNGVMANIPCRQIAGTIAGYCHARAAYQHASAAIETKTAEDMPAGYTSTNWADKFAVWSFVIGVVFVSILIFIK